MRALYHCCNARALHFGAVNEIYGGYFKDAPPARATVQVAGLPRGALVEIDAVAVVSGS